MEVWFPWGVSMMRRGVDTIVSGHSMNDSTLIARARMPGWTSKVSCLAGVPVPGRGYATDSLTNSCETGAGAGPVEVLVVLVVDLAGWLAG